MPVCRPHPPSSIVGYANFGTGDWATQAGAAFSPINSTGVWVNETSVFGSEVAAGDTVMMFNSEVWDLDSWGFLGFDGEGQGLGWAYSYTDTETWEPASDTVASFETKQGDSVTYQPVDGVSGLTVAGQVTDTTKPATWTLSGENWIGSIMNPYPVDTTFADLETFAVPGDTLMVFNYVFWDLDSYGFLGAGEGWAVTTTDDETWEPKEYIEKDSTKVVLPAGISGSYQPCDSDGRVWTVNLNK